MSTVVAALITLAGLVLVFAPLLMGAGQDEAAEPEDGPSRELLELERRRLLAELREIDLDLTMGKMSESDHAALRSGLELQAVEVMDRLAALEDGGEEE